MTTPSQPRSAVQVPRLLAVFLLVLLVVTTSLWFAARVRATAPPPTSVATSPSEPEQADRPAAEPRAGGGRPTRGSPNDITPRPAQSLITVPDLVGQPYQEATAALDDLGLRHRVRREHAEATSGTVIGTDPSAGSEVRLGRRVTLQVSAGPQPPPVTVSIKENGLGGLWFDPAAITVQQDQPVVLENITQGIRCDLELSGLSFSYATGTATIEGGRSSTITTGETGVGAAHCSSHSSGLEITVH